MKDAKFSANKFLRQGQLLFIAVFALSGLIVSGLWFYTAQKSWKGVMLKRTVDQKMTVSEETLVNVWEDIRELDQSFLPGRHVHFAGLANWLVIKDQRVPIDIRTKAFLESEEKLLNALAHEPMDAGAWARMAWLWYLQEGPSTKVVSALRMSVYTAPAKRDLVFWRIQMAGLNREYWDDGFESLMQRQVVYGSRISERRLEAVLNLF